MLAQGACPTVLMTRQRLYPIEPNPFEGSDTMSNRILHLLERHKKLDRVIGAAQARASADRFELLRLKKLKLALKDRIARRMIKAPA